MIKITDKSLCCGCSACAQKCPTGAISMQTDDEGFLYPQIHVGSCIDCNICENVCPMLNNLSDASNTVEAYAYKNNNDEIRKKSSSGGAFTALAEAVLDNGGVVFGAAFDESFNVTHSCVEDFKSIGKFRGSKYVQSKIGNSYKDAETFLKQGRLVLFTGTPCQIEGLLTFLRKDYPNLITQDVICHGVPSPMVWQKYIFYRSKKAKCQNIREVSFRNKDKGWKNFAMLFSFDNGFKYRKYHHYDFMMQAFLQDMCLRESCYKCLFRKNNRQADFTLADFWGIDNYIKDFDDDRGCSLILVHSEKGKELFNRIKYSGEIIKVDVKTALQQNKSMTISPVRPQSRDWFMSEVLNSDFNKITKKYCKQETFKLLRQIKRKICKFVK